MSRKQSTNQNDERKANQKGNNGRSNQGSKKRDQNRNSNRGNKGKGRSNSNTCSKTEQAVMPSANSTPRFAHNPQEWYNRYPELADVAGRSSFTLYPGQISGNKLYDTSKLLEQPSVVHYNYIALPGVCAIHFLPSIGGSGGSQDPASLVARELYTKVRKEFSNDLSVDAPDLAIQIIALANVYAYIATLKRVYRAISVYNPVNRSLPEGLLYAMGFTMDQVDSLVEHKNDLFVWINQLIHSVSSFICPSVFPLIDRWYWLCDNVFLDESSIQSQMYIFVPDGFFRFELLDTPDQVKAGGLEMVAFQPGTIKTDITTYLYEYGKQLISYLSGWSESFNINGYFMKAFGTTSAFAVQPLTLDEVQEAIYSPDVLYQIHNSTALPTHLPNDVQITYDWQISQDPRDNSIHHLPMVTVKSPAGGLIGMLQRSQVTLELPVGVNAPLNVIEASRLTASYEITAADPNTATEMRIRPHCATEAVLRYIIYRPNDAQPNGWSGSQVSGLWYEDFTAPTGVDPYTLIPRFNMMSKFELAPMIPTVFRTNGEALACIDWSLGEGITFLGHDQFNKINEVCLLSMLNAYSV